MSTSTSVQNPPRPEPPPPPSSTRPLDARPSDPGGGPPDPGSPTGRLVLGLALVVAGLVWLLDLSDVLEVRAAVVLPAAVLVVGVALLALARDPADHGGLVVLGAVLSGLLLLGATASAVAGVPVSGGVGDRVERPRVLADLGDLDLSAGSLELDLTDLDVPARDVGEEPDVLEASVGMGELVVRVPPDVAVRVRADVGMGELQVLDVDEGGIGVDAETETPGFADAERRLELRLHVNLGQVEVRS